MYRYYPDSTIPGIFRNRAGYYRDDAFLRHRVADFWIDICWEETYIKTNAISSYLINCGVNPGDRIALYSGNRPEWVFADLGILSTGAADVTIPAALEAAEAAFICNDSGATICFCSGRREADNLLSARNDLPGLEQIIAFDHGDYGDDIITTLDMVIQEGLENDRSEEIESRVRALDPDAVMTVMYMPDIAGYPKGISLSARDILGELPDLRMLDIHPARRDAVLSALPLSDALERSSDYYRTMYRGGSIAFSPGADRLHADRRENTSARTERELHYVTAPETRPHDRSG
ncbi:MAG TPA: AMP-binding protein [Spirochaetota bacterium]|nr:AMP-binding protein [Spirochaetota bacterium]HPC41996.1 AMP-binding protein [Spirochaetota bacterium]HPL18507.1 AMP-binding protein [Spirochaetota bacterium]HQF06958.1 AMP-binding protein [Spirochaetota bacterium]HQH95695.1 AMP-binding protein [Spirochaetota bacterium]